MSQTLHFTSNIHAQRKVSINSHQSPLYPYLKTAGNNVLYFDRAEISINYSSHFVSYGCYSPILFHIYCRQTALYAQNFAVNKHKIISEYTRFLIEILLFFSLASKYS